MFTITNILKIFTLSKREAKAAIVTIAIIDTRRATGDIAAAISGGK